MEHIAESELKRPNRILVRIDYDYAIGQIEALGVWAERPDEVIVSVSDAWWEIEEGYEPEVFGLDGKPIYRLMSEKEAI